MEDIKDILLLKDNSQDRCILFADFIKSLNHLIIDTYYDDESMNETDRKNHFNWCWKKNVENFEAEGVRIDGDKLKDYFFAHFKRSFLDTPEKGDINRMLRNMTVWDYIFDLNTTKKEADIELFIRLYNLMIAKTF